MTLFQCSSANCDNVSASCARRRIGGHVHCGQLAYHYGGQRHPAGQLLPAGACLEGVAPGGTYLVLVHLCHALLLRDHVLFDLRPGDSPAIATLPP